MKVCVQSTGPAVCWWVRFKVWPLGGPEQPVLEFLHQVSLSEVDFHKCGAVRQPEEQLSGWLSWLA